MSGTGETFFVGGLFCRAHSNLLSQSSSVSVCSPVHYLKRFVISSVAVRAFPSAFLRQYCPERFVIGSVAVRVFLSVVLWQYCLEWSSLLSRVNSITHQLSNDNRETINAFLVLFFFMALWRSPRLYIPKQLFSEISVNSGFWAF